MKKIRVMQIINSLDIGGAERVAINIAANLDPQRFDPMILTLEGLGPFSAVLDRQGIEYASLFKKPGTRPSTFFGIAQQIRERKIDIVTTHNYGALYYGSFGSRIGGCRRLLHVDHNRMYASKRRLLIPHKLPASMAYKVIAVSKEIRTYLISHEGIKPERIGIISNGIDEGLYTGNLDRRLVKTRLGIPEDRILIGTGARLVPEKGLTHLLDAMSILGKKRGDFLLVIAGDGPLRKDLEKRVRDNGLSSHVSFLGERTDFHEIIRLFDIYVLPSVSEGLPLSLLEAMAARKAIVASKVGGIPDVITAGNNGLLVPPGEPRPLSDAIGYLMDNPLKRSEFGERAYAGFREKHSAKTMADAYGLLYEQMMETGRVMKYPTSSCGVSS